MTLSSDLLISLVAIIAISGGLFCLGARVGRRSRSGFFAGAAVLVLVLYAIWLSDNPVLTHVLPVANVLLWGNLQLPAAAFLGGIAWSSLRGPRWQRSLLVTVLLSIGLWREAGPLIGRPPPVGPARWTNGVCRQSSTSSCSAAAAATLLAANGVTATEAEMIKACLTQREGTTTLGLYRGLKLKAAGAGLRVYADNPSTDTVDRWPLPAVVTISLPGLEKDSFRGGIGHSIVAFRWRGDGKIEIGDPFAGRQIWTRQQFIAAYGGDVMALVRGK